MTYEANARTRWDWEEKYVGQKGDDLRALVQQYGPPPAELLEDFDDVLVAWDEVERCRR